MYRIKIDKLVNGEKRYTPQMSSLHISGGWVKKQEIVWNNLTSDKFLKEEDARMVIVEHRRREEIKKGNEVKSTKYKMVY